MSDVTLSFTIQGDSEGYVTFECPYCGSEFKLQAGEYQDEDIPVDELFCPYCGLTKDPADFWSADVREQVEILTENYMADLINEAFGKMKKSMNRKNGIIKMDFKPLKKKAEKNLSEKDSVETEFECDYCNRHVKVLYNMGASKIFCPYCGVDL